MKLLFTGASGFLGSNIIPRINTKYDITTLGLSPEDDYQTDLSKEVPSFNSQFDIVLHAAGRAHIVAKKRSDKRLFYNVNYQGTVNLCHGLEKSKIPKSFIYISTVSVYGGNCEEKITEEHPLNGINSYALSKIQGEKFLVEWCRDNNVVLGIVRPSLIAGINPPGNLGEMIHSIRRGKYFSISGNNAHKSFIMAQDIANLIPILASRGGIYNLCDSNHITIKELEKLISSQLGKNPPLSIPYPIAKIAACIGDIMGNIIPFNSLKLKKITQSLTFSNEKARRELDWEPLSVLDNFKVK